MNPPKQQLSSKGILKTVRAAMKVIQKHTTQ